MKTIEPIFEGKPDVVDTDAEHKAIACCLFVLLFVAAAAGLIWFIIHLIKHWI